MGYALLADVVVAIHLTYVAFIVGGELVICLGAVLRWAWVRNLWFRLAHLAAILVVVVESVLRVPCPLTVWENQFRALAGQEVIQGTFMGRLFHALVFIDMPLWVFPFLYAGCTLLLLGTLVLVPPRWRRASRGTTATVDDLAPAPVRLPAQAAK